MLHSVVLNRHSYDFLHLRIPQAAVGRRSRWVRRCVRSAPGGSIAFGEGDKALEELSHHVLVGPQREVSFGL